MDLRYTPEETRLPRPDAHAFSGTEDPGGNTREKVRRRGGMLRREDMRTCQRIMNAHGLAVPNWPVEWGGKKWTADGALHFHRGGAGA